jgi:lipid A 3-O-deacylase
VGNNIYKGQGQQEIGEGFEFMLQGDIGVKYLISEKWAVSVEGDFRHISNADLAPRNEGLNSVGGLTEVSYFFH